MNNEDFDNEESVGFPPSERKISTQAYDLSVDTLVNQWVEKIIILPPIQREYVWDNTRASRLIESLLLNIPIPVLYFAETKDSKWEVIDGHQRINSVFRYTDNQFRLSSINILSEYKGKRFHQLPEKEQRYLKMRMMRAIVIENDSHPNMKFEVFERLNTGSISLNAQELRNSMYRGTFNEMLHGLVKESTFRNLIGTAKPRKRIIDEELILRFFAIREQFDSYKPDMKRFLNEYMQSVKDSDEQQIEILNTIFINTVIKIDTSLGSKAFRITDKSGTIIERAINKALFDAQMIAFSWVVEEVDVLENKKQSVFYELAELYADQTFKDSIQLATSDRARTHARIIGLIQALERAGLTIETPYSI